MDSPVQKNGLTALSLYSLFSLVLETNSSRRTAKNTYQELYILTYTHKHICFQHFFVHSLIWSSDAALPVIILATCQKIEKTKKIYIHSHLHEFYMTTCVFFSSQSLALSCIFRWCFCCCKLFLPHPHALWLICSFFSFPFHSFVQFLYSLYFFVSIFFSSCSRKSQSNNIL